ncbi:MAG: 2Fe-2S iron-sulfur cluster-binding protein [Trueperaceae bacterium]
MPTLNVNGKHGTFASNKRLVLAIKELGVTIGHRCGGNAKCTTCRVTFHSGEPTVMTQAEYDKLQEKSLLGEARLSCQLTCSEDMELTAPMTLENQSAWKDTGPQPADTVIPVATWLSKEELAQG